MSSRPWTPRLLLVCFLFKMHYGALLTSQQLLPLPELMPSSRLARESSMSTSLLSDPA